MWDTLQKRHLVQYIEVLLSSGIGLERNKQQKTFYSYFDEGNDICQSETKNARGHRKKEIPALTKKEYLVDPQGRSTVTLITNFFSHICPSAHIFHLYQIRVKWSSNIRKSLHCINSDKNHSGLGMWIIDDSFCCMCILSFIEQSQGRIQKIRCTQMQDFE